MKDNTLVKVLTVEFDHRLKISEIPKFRGAVISSMENAPIQFHNHGETGLVYSYPLIQYKSINGKAFIICINDSIKSTGNLFMEYQQQLKIGNRELMFPIKNINITDLAVGQSENPIEYSIAYWLPFNQDNYNKFKDLKKLSEQCCFLEKILVGNIISFAKGAGIYLDFKIDCAIQSIEKTNIAKFKDVKMTAYDLRFTCNVSLPNYIGLGKGVSHGFGTIRKIQ